MRMILPLILALIGLGGGVGAGFFLAPEPEMEAMGKAECTCPPAHAEGDANGDGGAAQPEPIPVADALSGDGAEEDSRFDYVKLNNQFVVPVVKDGRVAALVVMSLSVEVEPGTREQVFLKEPKLRDVFLQVLFDHANAGGFDGNFTSGLNMAALRTGLVGSAQQVLGSLATDVLIQDIGRQDS